MPFRLEPYVPDPDLPANRAFVRLTTSEWGYLPLPGGCLSWNGRCDCGREADHPGNHVCAGCHGQWSHSELDDAIRDACCAQCRSDLADARDDEVREEERCTYDLEWWRRREFEGPGD